MYVSIQFVVKNMPPFPPPPTPTQNKFRPQMRKYWCILSNFSKNYTSHTQTLPDLLERRILSGIVTVKVIITTDTQIRERKENYQSTSLINTDRRQNYRNCN